MCEASCGAVSRWAEGGASEAQEGPGGPRSAREGPDGSGRAQKVPRRVQESPGGATRAQEGPGKYPTLQMIKKLRFYKEIDKGT